MQKKYKYIALFFNDSELYQQADAFRTERLAVQPDFLHITFAYQPEEVDESLFGTQADVLVTGYGNNGQNEGLRVSLQSKDPRLQALADTIKTPHITLSIAKNAKARNTKNVHFHSIKPFTVKGTFGGYLNDCRKVVLQKD